MKPSTFLILALLSFDKGDSIDSDIANPVKELITRFNPQTSRACAVLSIGGPELMRYSLVSDFLETEILELSYAKYGLEYADFSIGKFQMKPSFVQKLEKSVCDEPELFYKYQKLVTYPVTDIQTIRRERIRRIKSTEYQYLILSAFYDYCLLTYCDYLENISADLQVRFIGTAYNMGFDKTTAVILKYLPRKNFPYGARFQGDQYAYSSVSSEIFKQLIKSLCKSTYSTYSQDCYSGLVRNCL